MMKQTFKMLTIALFVACCVAACSKSKDNDDAAEVPKIPESVTQERPEEVRLSIFMDSLAQQAIIGKWDLVAFGPSMDDLTCFSSDSILMAFLPDGTFMNYHTETDEYIEHPLFKTYVIDSLYFSWNNERSYMQGRYDYAYKLMGNTIMMTYMRGNMEQLMTTPSVFIYKKPLL